MLEGNRPEEYAAGVVVGIPTYRRPERLSRLLHSLEPSLATSRGILLIVADNGCDDSTRAIVEDFAERWPNTRYMPVPTRGISANRNALIDAFLAEPNAEWLGMLDDDLAVGDTWLEAMMTVGTAADADVVGGPYAYTGDVKNFLISNSLQVYRQRQPSGICKPFHAAGNILLRRRLLEAGPVSRFDSEFGLSGGEDYDFFCKAADRGARFAWCDEAFADEMVDPERLTNRAVAYRYFSSGIYMGVSDRARRGWSTVVRSQTNLLARSVTLLIYGMISVNRERMLRGSLRGLIASGGLLSLTGFRAFRYR